jgi:phosphohistidine phosphatase
MQLYLVRHGESLPSEIDPNQPLSPQGIKESEAVAQLLKQASLEIDEIIHSTKIRAKQTAEILGQAIAPELTLIQREGLKPMDPIEPILSEIRSFDRNVMLVGHLPFMEKLLTTLLIGKEGQSPVNLTGSCVICLEKEQENSWRIAWVVSPNLCNRNLAEKHP